MITDVPNSFESLRQVRLLMIYYPPLRPACSVIHICWCIQRRATLPSWHKRVDYQILSLLGTWVRHIVYWLVLQAKAAPVFENCQNLISPPPLSTTMRTTWKKESRPDLHAESACPLYSAVGLWLLRYHQSRRWYSKILNPPPRQLSTTIRTTWNKDTRPVFHAESACPLHLAVAPLVVELSSKSALISEDCENFYCPPPITIFLYNQNIFRRWI
jgi:hypothetical protein